MFRRPITQEQAAELKTACKALSEDKFTILSDDQFAQLKLSKFIVRQPRKVFEKKALPYIRESIKNFISQSPSVQHGEAVAEHQIEAWAMQYLDMLTNEEQLYDRDTPASVKSLLSSKEQEQYEVISRHVDKEMVKWIDSSEGAFILTGHVIARSYTRFHGYNTNNEYYLFELDIQNEVRSIFGRYRRTRDEIGFNLITYEMTVKYSDLHEFVSRSEVNATKIHSIAEKFQALYKTKTNDKLAQEYFHLNGILAFLLDFYIRNNSGAFDTILTEIEDVFKSENEMQIQQSLSEILFSRLPIMELDLELFQQFFISMEQLAIRCNGNRTPEENDKLAELLVETDLIHFFPINRYTVEQHYSCRDKSSYKEFTLLLSIIDKIGHPNLLIDKIINDRGAVEFFMDSRPEEMRDFANRLTKEEQILEVTYQLIKKNSQHNSGPPPELFCATNHFLQAVNNIDNCLYVYRELYERSKDVDANFNEFSLFESSLMIRTMYRPNYNILQAIYIESVYIQLGQIVWHESWENSTTPVGPLTFNHHLPEGIIRLRKELSLQNTEQTHRGRVDAIKRAITIAKEQMNERYFVKNNSTYKLYELIVEINIETIDKPLLDKIKDRLADVSGTEMLVVVHTPLLNRYAGRD